MTRKAILSGRPGFAAPLTPHRGATNPRDGKARTDFSLSRP
ncbi:MULTISPECIES: hypothetical protein [unclassified Roseovarius]|nr:MULTISPECIES: hypothetical protein [unclassified Roseovarius]